MIFTAKQPIFAKALKVADYLTIQVLHSPAMLPEKPAKQPKKSRARFTYGAALSPAMASQVDKLVAQSGGTISDVIRTALARLFASTENFNPVIDPPGQPSVQQPRIAARYTGSGGSDVRVTQAVKQRQTDRLRGGLAGEKMMDKSPVR